MDTETFLRRVMPKKGIKVLALPTTFKDKKTGKDRKGWKYRKFPSVSAAAEAALQFDRQGKTVYFAVNGYGDWYTDDNGKKRLRTQENVVACRSLYDDFDVDPADARKYVSREAALTDIVKLAQALRMTPTITSSGGGYHAYFHLNTDVDENTWRELSARKRDITSHLKLKVDHSVDMDSARVLRPVGTHNRKKDTPRPVELIKEGKAYTLDAMRATLTGFIERNKVLPAPTSKPRGGNNPFSVFTGDYPPSSAHKIIEHCYALKQVADARGNVTEPLWYAMLGTVKLCSEGEALCHEWSNGHPNYSYEETQEKIDQWDRGATSCDHFDALLGCREACKFSEKVNYPIALGHVETAESSSEPPKVLTAEELEQLPDDVTTVGGVDIPYWPRKGFRWDDKDLILQRGFVDDDGVVHWRPFARTLLYPINRVRDDEGNWAIHWRALEKNGDWREFFMPTSELASPDLMAKTLYNNEVFLFRSKNARGDMVDYAEGFIERLQAYRIEVRTLERLGWQDNFSGYALGDKIIRLKGEEPALYNDKIPHELAGGFGVSGTLEQWVENVDYICNRPRGEVIQFCMCHAMGAPLVELFHSDNWHGLMVMLTGKGGEGKTTNATIATSFFGKPELFNKQGSEDGTTFSAGLKRLFLMNSIPSIFDELTGRSADELMRLGYGSANGKDKDRLRPDGAFATVAAPVFKNSFGTSNDSVHELIAALPPSYKQEATQLRFFEIKIPEGYVDSVFPDVSKSFIEKHNTSQYGTAVRPYIRFIMENREWVERQISAAREKFNPYYKEETSERFYIDTIVTAVVAGKIASRLGLIKFDVNNMQKWAINHVISMRESRKYYNTDVGEFVAQYIASLPGRLIVTKHYKDARSKAPPEVPIEQLRAPAVGRVALEDKRIFVTVKSINDWAQEHKITPAAMREELETKKYLVLAGDGQVSQRMYIARGTTMPSAQTRCYELNYDMVFGHIPAMRVIYNQENNEGGSDGAEQSDKG